MDQYGEFTPTAYKVGINSPPASSYQLNRTQTRIDEVNEKIEVFYEQIKLNREWYAEKQAEADAQSQSEVTLKIAIILIEFTDVKHFKDENYRPDGYTTADFDSMMFSNNYWNDPQRHPEEELIFGSFRDYWKQMSKGKLNIIGKVVNPDNDEDGIPEWLEADSTREYYAGLNPGNQWNTLALEAIQKAIDSGYISEDLADSNYFDKYIVAYAQNAVYAGALKVHAQDFGGKYVFLAERSSSNLYWGTNWAFTHIGTYGHEFGHTIGFYEEYPGEMELGETDLFNFCLMARGIYNGPDRKAACPATLSPYYRIDMGWLPQPTLINSDHNDFSVEYDYENPNLYRINPIEAPTGMHYLFEVRQREGFDSYIPTPPDSFQYQSGTLLIWQHDVKSISINGNYYDRIRVKAADFHSNGETQLDDFFPSSGYQNYQSINDTTYPTASLGAYKEEYFTYTNMPAHFALNGLQKQVDNNITIDEIILHHPLRIVNRNIGAWQAVSVPYGLSDYSLSSIFPTAISAYKYVGGYVQVTTLANGPGYWVNFPSSTQWLSFQGTLIEYLEIPVTTGWNLTGSIPYVIPRPTVASEPPGIIQYIYRYDNPGGYILLTSNDHLSGGLGYWTKTTGSGKIILDRFAESSPLPKIGSFSEINLDEMDKFIITDADGYSQSLYVSNTDIDTVMLDINLDLPPFFSEMDFDSRFEYNEYVKKVSADSGDIDLNILVHSNSYPINLSWELNHSNGINYSFINDSGSGKISGILNEFGNATFNQLNKNRIKLLATINKSNSDLLIPEDYVLEQNYPNPFNPSTTIKFALPKESQVNLTVFNILGEKVKELKNEVMKPGYYEVNFNALMLASGIYLYSIQAGEFVQTKKMILMK